MSNEVAVAIVGGLFAVMGTMSTWQGRRVHKEFKPNGGNSLRDVLNRLEIRTELLHERMLDHVKHDELAQATLDKRLSDFETYSHGRWHKLDGKLAATNGWLALIFDKSPPSTDD